MNELKFKEICGNKLDHLYACVGQGRQMRRGKIVQGLGCSMCKSNKEVKAKALWFRTSKSLYIFYLKIRKSRKIKTELKQKRVFWF